MTCAYCRAVDRVERADRDKYENQPEKLDGMFWYARPYDPQRDQAAAPESPDKRRRSKNGAGGRGRLTPHRQTP